MLKDLVNLRKELHQHPELSGREEQTAKRIAEELSRYEPDEIFEEIGGTGVIAKFSSNNGSATKAILFRAELDAIAVQEESGTEYQSEDEGVMHGCGHDGHMAILIGLAHVLQNKMTPDLDVYLLFQPAEETGEGAARVMADERFQRIELDHAYALHNLPGFDEKSVLIKSDVFAAASVGMKVHFKGKSSHAAYPEQGVNPSKHIAEFIRLADVKLDHFRSKNSLNKAVNTYIRMGEPAFGISPGSAELGFTLRSPSDEELANAVNAIREIGGEIDNDFQGDLKMQKVEPFAATINSEKGIEMVKKAAMESGLEITELKQPFPWSEDFGEFRKKCPITLFGLGAGRDSAALHSETYDFNDQLIETGVQLFRAILEHHSS